MRASAGSTMPVAGSHLADLLKVARGRLQRSADNRGLRENAPHESPVPGHSALRPSRGHLCDLSPYRLTDGIPGPVDPEGVSLAGENPNPRLGPERWTLRSPSRICRAFSSPLL